MPRDGMDRELIDSLKRDMKLTHGRKRATRLDPGRVVKADTPSTLEEKLLRMEKRTQAGEQELRTGARGGLTNRMRHARR